MHHHPTPLHRFLKLLKPEGTDIGAMTILALAISVLATTVPIAAQQLVRAVTFGTLYQPIIILSLTLLLFLSFMAALQLLTRIVAEVIQQRLFVRTAIHFSQRLPKVAVKELQNARGPEALNRFLEIVTVQKVVSGFLLDGIGVVFTTVIGMILLALYHPFLLGYDFLLLLLIAVVIGVLGRGGTETSIEESVAKYRVTAWLQDLARCPVAFRLNGAAEFAVDRTGQLTTEYLDARRRHFRVLIRQIISVLIIQVMASTSLLGIGGFLVLQEQMTLGQLVAAELVVAMIIGALTKLLKQIEGFFDVMAAVDKLGHISDLPLEPVNMEYGLVSENADAGVASLMSRELHLDRILLELADRRASDRKHIALLEGPDSHPRQIADLLYGIHDASNSPVGILGHPDSADPRAVRGDDIALVREIEIFSGSIDENLHLGRSHLEPSKIRTAVETVGLTERIRQLPHGRKTILLPDGTPLSDSDSVLLMIARGIAAQPKVLIIDRLLDRLADDLARKILGQLMAENVSWQLVLITGREDLASLVPRNLASCG